MHPLTPDQAQSQALAWIEAIGKILAFLIVTGSGLYATWQTNKLKNAALLHKQQIDQNTARLNGQSQKIDTLLLGAEPPGKSTVAVAVSTSDDGKATTVSTDPTDTTAADAAKESTHV